MKARQFMKMVCLIGELFVLSEGCACAAVTFVDLVPDMTTNQFNVDFNVDIDGNGFRDVWFVQALSTSGLRSFSQANVRVQSSAGGDPGTFYAVPINLGQSVGAVPVSGASWVYSAHPSGYGLSTVVLLGSNLVTFGLWPGQDAYMGIELTLSDGIHYGWVHVEVEDFSTLGIIKDYAFETTPNTPIIAGAVPEPGRVGLFVITSLTFLMRRRRR
jgi:hypothetical protein